MIEKLTPLPKLTALAYALVVSPRPSRTGQRSKVFIWRKDGTARRVTLPSQKGHVTVHKSSKGMHEKLVPQG